MRLQHFTVELHNIRDPVMVHLWSQMHMVIIHMQAWVMCAVLVVESFGGSVISGEYVIDVSSVESFWLHTGLGIDLVLLFLSWYPR